MLAQSILCFAMLHIFQLQLLKYCQKIFLPPWMKRFTMIISAWCLQRSSKFSGQEFEEIHTNIGSLETLKQERIPPSTK